MRVLLTGAAGFIGFHTAKRLLARGDTVVGLDNLNDYYDVSLKEARLNQLTAHDNFRFVPLDVASQGGMEEVFSVGGFERVVHLAAQAGVRYSLENPRAYTDSNVQGFLHVLEGCRHAKIEHLVYASSSSVYGANLSQPFSEHASVNHPLSLYAATKKANELMAHTYSALFKLPTTGLRFFTVYGPWGRPDMALFLFTKNILAGKPIDVYNHGDMVRDFTYVDDIVEGVIRTLDTVATPDAKWSGASPDPATSFAPYRIYNIGGNSPTKLMDFIRAIEDAVGKKATLNLMEIQPGDVPSTAADTSTLAQAIGFRPATPVTEGVKKFVQWYREYYEV